MTYLSAGHRSSGHRATNGLTRHVAVKVGAGLVAVIAVALVLSSCTGSKPKPPRFVPEAGPGVFRGLGTWVDIFEVEAWRDPAATVATMQARGVHTIYLQASNYGREQAIVFPGGTAAFIDAAHARGMKVVGWYFPSWTDPKADLQHTLDAIAFRAPSGQGYDAFGIDIEPGLEPDPAIRTDALLALSRKVRAEVGPDYPLGAISPNPMRIKLESSYWPAFPYEELSRNYDAFLPMDYFGAVADASNKQGAFRYTRDGIRLIREGANRLSVPIHVIGGLSEDVTEPELAGFLKAIERGDAVGFSLYTYSTTGENDWPMLTEAARNMSLPSPGGASAGPASATPTASPA